MLPLAAYIGIVFLAFAHELLGMLSTSVPDYCVSGGAWCIALQTAVVVCVH